MLHPLNEDKYLEFAEEIVTESEIIVNHPTRTLCVSPLKKYSNILEKEDWDSYILENFMCIEIELPYRLVHRSFLDNFLEKKKKSFMKHDLYCRAAAVENKLKEHLIYEKANDRVELLKIAIILIEQIHQELKEVQ